MISKLSWTKLVTIPVAILLLLCATVVVAGSIDDSDGDGVPDVFDNCSVIPNGPTDALNQLDTDGDGFGNSCDCDFTQDGIVLVDDVADLFGAFNTTSELHDITGDGFVLVDDIAACFSLGFSSGPGPGATAI